MLFLVFYLASSLLAAYLSTFFFSEGMFAFENPGDVTNSIYYFGAILVFTAVVLLLIRISKKFVKFVFSALIFATIHFVFAPFLGIFSVLPALILTLALFYWRNWVVVDIVAILVSAGVIAIFGISLEPLPAITLLSILAVYDYVSVHKTGHMIKLAESLSELELPLLFVAPEGEKKSYMGVGDVVIPNVLFVSALFYSTLLHALMILTFSSVALVYLLKRVEKPAPGLPYLNTAAISGYLISSLLLSVFQRALLTLPS